MAMTETVQGTFRVDLASLETRGRVRGGHLLGTSTLLWGGWNVGPQCWPRRRSHLLLTYASTG